jgi:hypothetical protein
LLPTETALNDIIIIIAQTVNSDYVNWISFSVGTSAAASEVATVQSGEASHIRRAPPASGLQQPRDRVS